MRGLLIGGFFCLAMSVAWGQTCTMSNAGATINWTNSTAITCSEGDDSSQN